MVWAEHLGLMIEAIHNGEQPFIKLPHPVQTDDGIVVENLDTLGQSVCILRKP
jgi:hypothetical protein